MKAVIRKIWMITGYLFTMLAASAQVSMTLQVPPTGVLLKNQLWNMLLVSGSNGTLDITVNLSLQDIQTNQVLLTGSSRVLHLEKGATQLQAGDLSPVQYKYYSSIFNNDRDPNGLLPAGNYLACYSISTTHTSILTENCITVNVEPLSPPLLNMPSNEAMLQTSFPQFSWLPPTPVNIFNDLNYDLILVEVLAGQSSTEAIQNNVPVNNVARNRGLFYNYPASGRQLDTGRLYAWRIIARNNSSVISPSEVWTFKIQSPKLKTPSLNNSNYISLKNSGELTGTYVVENNTLRIKYYSFDNTHDTKVKLSGADGSIIKSFKQKIIYGDNFLSYTLNSAFSEGQLYSIEITDRNNNKHSASFRLKKQDR